MKTTTRVVLEDDYMRWRSMQVSSMYLAISAECHDLLLPEPEFGCRSPGPSALQTPSFRTFQHPESAALAHARS